MTREEAIDRLRKISEKTPIRTNGDDLVAITMAIQALSQEPICIGKVEFDEDKLREIVKEQVARIEITAEQESTDAISRQAVLDSLWKLDIELRPNAIDAIVNMINNLSSVTPKPIE